MEEPNSKTESIFWAALALESPDERSKYLDQACGDDSQQRARLLALLAAYPKAEQFLESKAVRAPATVEELPSDPPGTVIGGYKLLQAIGEGGMGTVYMAEQTHPVRRMVALKLIKPGLDSRQILARFEAERQALALMDHPNIAKVLGGGATENGRPYFVMELVKGVPITRFCDELRLAPKERLELFIPVCQAVQHAHQKGIIHRDLKPSNVLVALYDGQPVPKVIDFGVSKAAGQRLTEKTLFTEFGAIVGTPEYMSPEQATLNQLDIDTRSDIYSLGVLLYELLTGTTPLDRKRLKEAAFLEVLRVIREEEPPRPSTRLSTTRELPSIAARRRMEPRKLSGLVHGELDWIVMKALEKDRNRRYDTANGLAADLKRYLADEPVQACPPSAAYRLRKFSRKYRTLLRITALFVIFLIVAAAVSVWQAVIATRAERRALVDRDRAEASFRMARDAVDRLFTQVSQSPKLQTRGMETFRKDLLLDAKEFYERFIRERFDAPGVRYDLALAYLRLAQIYRELGDYTIAESSVARAIKILSDLSSAQPQTAEYRRDLAASYTALGLISADTVRWDQAEASFRQAISIQQALVHAHPDAAEYQYALARTYEESALMLHRADHVDDSAKRFEQALQLLNELSESHPLEAEHQSVMATTQLNLGQVYVTRGRYEDAVRALTQAQIYYEKLVRGQPEAPPEQWQSLARSEAILGVAYMWLGRNEKAEAVQEQALEIFEKVAREHPDVQEYAYDVGRCFFQMARTADQAGKYDEALTRYDKAIEIIERLYDKGYLRAQTALLDSRIDRAGTLATRGDHVGAAAAAESVARAGKMGSVHLYDVACVLSRCAAAAEHDLKLAPADRARHQAQYADRAMDFLRLAIAQGWHNELVMKQDHDLDALRGLKEFQKLQADLEAKTKP